MRYVIVVLMGSLSLGGCLDFGTGTTGAGGARTCAQLGWACGTDGYGASCGVCVGGQVCTSGACNDPGAVVIANGATAFAIAGGYTGTFFTLSGPATVRFTATSTDLFQAGVFTVADWNLFAAGQSSGALVLSNATPSVTDTVSAPAGTYVFGFRCVDGADPCTIRYSLSATY